MPPLPFSIESLIQPTISISPEQHLLNLWTLCMKSQPQLNRESSESSIESNCNSTSNTISYNNNSIVDRSKLFKCDHCDKTFAAHYNLTRHLPVHTGARPFVCKVRILDVLIIIRRFIVVIIVKNIFRFVGRPSDKPQHYVVTKLFIQRRNPMRYVLIIVLIFTTIQKKRLQNFI